MHYQTVFEPSSHLYRYADPADVGGLCNFLPLSAVAFITGDQHRHCELESFATAALCRGTLGSCLSENRPHLRCDIDLKRFNWSPSGFTGRRTLDGMTVVRSARLGFADWIFWLCVFLVRCIVRLRSVVIFRCLCFFERTGPGCLLLSFRAVSTRLLKVRQFERDRLVRSR